MRNYLLLLIATSLVFSGCASYNQKLVVAQVATNNAALPYVGGQSAGSVWVGYYSCIGKNCPPADNGTVLAQSIAKAIAVSANSITTSGPVKVTVTPIAK